MTAHSVANMLDSSACVVGITTALASANDESRIRITSCNQKVLIKTEGCGLGCSWTTVVASNCRLAGRLAKFDRIMNSWKYVYLPMGEP